VHAAGKTAELPELLSVVGAQAVEIAVVGNEVDLAPPDHRGETHRPSGEEPPALAAGCRVEGRDAVIDHRGNEHGLAGHDRLVRCVEEQSHFKREGRTRRAKLTYPVQV